MTHRLGSSNGGGRWQAGMDPASPQRKKRPYAKDARSQPECSQNTYPGSPSLLENACLSQNLLESTLNTKPRASTQKDLSVTTPSLQRKSGSREGNERISTATHRKCWLGSSCTYPAAQSIWGIHTWLSNVIKYGPVGLIISLTPNHLLKDMFPICLWTGAPVRRKKQSGWVGTPQKLTGGKDFSCHETKMSKRRIQKQRSKPWSPLSLLFIFWQCSSRTKGLKHKRQMLYFCSSSQLWVLVFCFAVLCLLFWFWDSVFQDSLGWPGSCSKDKSRLKFNDPPGSDSWVLRLLGYLAGWGVVMRLSQSMWQSQSNL